MFTMIASVVSLVWIQEHLPLVLGILAALIVLIIVLHRRRKKKRQAYLALPVQFLANKSTRVYHAAGCPQLSRVSQANLVAIRLPAETRHMRPCSSCCPRWPSNPSGGASA